MPASENVALDTTVEVVPKPWQPPLFPRQWDAVRVCFTKTKGQPNIVLLNGPRWSSKTFASCHIMAMHGWYVSEANIMVLTLTQSVGTDSGVWTNIIKTFSMWIDAGFGMQWVREPYLDSGTKKPAFIVTNQFSQFVNGKWKNVTKVQLDSLKNEDEAEERYKGKEYTMIFVNEFSKFVKRKTFDTLKQTLRGVGRPEEDFLFLADTNPSLTLGKAHFIWDLYYCFRTMSDEELKEKFKTDDEDSLVKPEDLIPLRNALRLVEFTVDDNLAATPQKKASLRADFGHDPDLYAAYYLGAWVTASTDAIFYKVFRPRFHVRGELSNASNKDPEILIPQDGCFELITGNDPGGVNCASVVLEKWIQVRDVEQDGRKIKKEVSVFKVIDELVVVGEDFRLEDFIEELVNKMQFWEAMCGKPGKLNWVNWSDRSCWDMKVPFTDRYWHSWFYELSGGKIQLIAVERGRGSVGQRIDLFRKLLFEERIFFSAEKCPQTIQMCKSIRRGTSNLALIQKGDKHKHVFDALTYALISECAEELQHAIHMTRRGLRKDSVKEAGLIQIAV